MFICLKALSLSLLCSSLLFYYPYLISAKALNVDLYLFEDLMCICIMFIFIFSRCLSISVKAFNVDLYFFQSF